jgi:DNA gyrase/topoisomerase IV subunit A
VTLISAGGMVLRTPVAEIPQMGRATRGSRVMELKEGDQVTALAVLESEGSD